MKATINEEINMKTIKKTMQQPHRSLLALVVLATGLTATLAIGQAN
jgi:hypothetical protein